MAALRSLLQSVTAELGGPGPLPAAAVARLPLLCSGLGQLATELEQDCAAELDALQAALSALCADTEVKLGLRLLALEVLELQSLGWRLSPATADYFSQRSLAAQSQHGREPAGLP